MRKIIADIKLKINKILKRDKWKMYLYANNQCIKKLYIDENEKPFENFYVITVYFKKHIFGSNIAKVVVKPDKLKFTDNNKKCVHIETKLFEGVAINV